MKDFMKKIIDSPILKALFYFILSLVFVLSAVFLSNLISTDEKLVPTPTEWQSVSCPSDYLSYKELAGNTKSIVHLINEKTSMNDKQN